jgi:hypothetical protein
MIGPYVLLRVGSHLQTSEAGKFPEEIAADTSESWTPNLDSFDWPLEEEREWNTASVVSNGERSFERDGSVKEQVTAEVRPLSAASNYCSIFSNGTSIQTLKTARSQNSINGLRKSLASHLNEMR